MFPEGRAACLGATSPGDSLREDEARGCDSFNPIFSGGKGGETISSACADKRSSYAYALYLRVLCLSVNECAGIGLKPSQLYR
jgi:hypothetical protein